MVLMNHYENDIPRSRRSAVLLGVSNVCAVGLGGHCIVCSTYSRQKETFTIRRITGFQSRAE
jgi:hypothetical protein